MPTSELMTRLLWAVAILLTGVAVYLLANRALLLRARHNRPNLPEDPGKVPTILYFTTPECVVCKAAQRPALKHLQDQFGDRLAVIEVDAQQRPELASQWGVLSVPTTFVLDARGEVQHINHGLAREEKLLYQIGQAP